MSRPASLALLLLGAAALPAQGQTGAAGQEPVISLAPLSGSAAEEAVQLAPVSAVADRSERALEDIPANVTLIPRLQLERRQAVTVEDVLRYEPGVFINRQTSGTDPFASFGGITIRGVGGNRVQTIVDGSRTLERVTDSTREVVDPSNLRMVEVVRGPASVLYGADALGGIVAYETKDPADYLRPGASFGGQANTTYSTLDQGRTSGFTIAGRHGDVEALLGYTRRDANEPDLTRSRSPNGIWNCTRNPQAIPCNRLNPADIASDNLLGKLVWNLAEGNRLRLTGEYFNRRTDVDQRYDLGPATGGITNAAWYRNQDIERFRISLDQDWRVGSPYLDRLSWRLGYHPQRIERTGTRYRRLANGQAQRVEDSYAYEERFIEADISAITLARTGPLSHRLTYGFDGDLARTDYERSDLTTNLTTGVSTRATGGGFNFANADTRRADVYIQDEVGLFGDRWTITPGLRHATYRIEPDPAADYRFVPGREPRTLSTSETLFRLGTVFRFDQEHSVYAQYAEGFKMPTAEQLFTSVPSLTSSVIPNPDLKPERVRSYEAGFRGVYPRGRWSLAAFHAEYEDFIQSFVTIPGTADVTYRNLSEVTVSGVEASGAYQFARDWLVSGSASYQHGNQRSAPGASSVPFDGASPFRMVAGLRWTPEGTGVDAELLTTYQSEVERSSSPQIYQPKAFTVVDFNLSYRPVENLILRAGVFNLFDARYLSVAPGVTYTRSEFTSDAVKATNPIELQVAPGRYFRFGAQVNF